MGYWYDIFILALGKEYLLKNFDTFCRGKYVQMIGTRYDYEENDELGERDYISRDILPNYHDENKFLSGGVGEAYWMKSITKFLPYCKIYKCHNNYNHNEKYFDHLVKLFPMLDLFYIAIGESGDSIYCHINETGHSEILQKIPNFRTYKYSTDEKINELIQRHIMKKYDVFDDDDDGDEGEDDNDDEENNEDDNEEDNEENEKQEERKDYELIEHFKKKYCERKYVQNPQDDNFFLDSSLSMIDEHLRKKQHVVFDGKFLNLCLLREDSYEAISLFVKHNISFTSEYNQLAINPLMFSVKIKKHKEFYLILENYTKMLYENDYFNRNILYYLVLKNDIENFKKVHGIFLLNMPKYITFQKSVYLPHSDIMRKIYLDLMNMSKYYGFKDLSKIIQTIIQ